MYLTKGILQKLICRSRDCEGDFVLVQVEHESLGLIRLRSHKNKFPNHMLPFIRGLNVEFCWGSEEIGLMLGLAQQGPAVSSAIFNVALALVSTKKVDELPFVSDPFAYPVDQPHLSSKEDQLDLDVPTKDQLDNLINILEDEEQDLDQEETF